MRLELNIAVVVESLYWKAGQITMVAVRANCTISMFWQVTKTQIDATCS